MIDPATAAMLVQLAPTLIQGAGSLTSQFGDIKQAKAYQNYLNSLTGGLENKLTSRASEYEGKLSDLFNSAEPQFLQEANTQLPELAQIQKDISQQSAEAQRQNRAQVANELASQGVRGGQAATLANRATGELNRNLQRDLNQTAYDEASNRQNARLNYYNQKALIPYSNLSDAYGHGSKSANSALAGAWGNSLSNAYTAAIMNYGNTVGNKGSVFGGLMNKGSGMLGNMAGSYLSKKVSSL